MRQLNTLAFLLAIACSGCTSRKEFADTILLNGKVVTVDEDFSIASAVAIRNGKFMKVGDNEAIRGLAGKETVVIDAKGHAIIPGLIEGHAHPIPASQSEIQKKIPDVHTIDEVMKWIAHEVREKEDNEWIIHPKFFITRMNDLRQITKEELDAIAPDNPVFLNGSYGGMINSRAIHLSGMTTLIHPGILRDEKTGKANGVIRRSAFNLLKLPPAPTLSDAQKSEALKNLFHLYNSVGITSVCSGGGTVDELKDFEKLSRQNELTVRVYHNVRIPFDLKRPKEEIADTLRKLGLKTGDGNEWVKVGALKIVLDGGMLTGTAFLHEGWGDKARELYGIKDPQYRGELMFSKGELIKIITAADECGWKFTAHVTGGGGVDTLLAAYEAVNRSRPLNGKRFSVIHGNFYTPDAIKTMARLGIYADMQPAWFYKDTDLLHHVLGDERIRNFHPYRSLTEAGVVVNGGSDHMVKNDPDLSINPYNPFPAMWSVITRKTDKGTVFNPEQAISREEALKMYTINNARASFEEDIKGSIEEGKLADLAVVSEDLLTCEADTLRNIKSILTMVGGKIVFDNNTLQRANGSSSE